MAYFLKKSNLKKGVYLQIYESFYDPERNQTAHKSYKALGYVDELVAKGIDDPISFYSEKVKQLNAERKAARDSEKVRKISDDTPAKHLGYFPFKALNDSLGIKGYLDIFQRNSDFRFNVYSVMSALIYARVVQPCSKLKTYYEVLPSLFEPVDFSSDQMYACLEYIGAEYEKIIEMYNAQISALYGFNTDHAYFDCTNFYFEIDREDDFRRKGPSKENRREPLVGLGLLLDGNQIPIGMEVYPGNESEKPVIRKVIDKLKKRSHVEGRTIQIADKGLNCAENIMYALSAGDGYIFSKSVKMLPAIEKEWVLLDNDYREVHDSNGHLLYRIKECVDEFTYDVPTSNGKKRKVTITEKRVVTFNPDLARKKCHEINKLVEKAMQLKTSAAKRSEYGDSAKYVTFTAADSKGNATGGKVKVSINQSAIEEDRRLAGYNLLVTSETKMNAADIYKAYHNLWRIEESFRIMKSYLDARPVYLQKQETITGHFLICYLSVTLLRLLQFKVLGDKYSSEEIMNFAHSFDVTRISDRNYINIARKSEFITKLSEMTGLPIDNLHLKESDIKSIQNYRFKTKHQNNSKTAKK